MRDLRDHPRFESHQRLWCDSQSLTLYICSTNISLQGLFVQAVAPPPEGTRLRLSAVGDGIDAPAFDALAEVRWRRSRVEGARSGMGLRLLEFERGEQAFAQLVARHREGRGRRRHWLLVPHRRRRLTPLLEVPHTR